MTTLVTTTEALLSKVMPEGSPHLELATDFALTLFWAAFFGLGEAIPPGSLFQGLYSSDYKAMHTFS